MNNPERGLITSAWESAFSESSFSESSFSKELFLDLYSREFGHMVRDSFTT